MLLLATSCDSNKKWNDIEFYEVNKSEQFTEDYEYDDDDEFADFHDDSEREFDVSVDMQFMQSGNGISEEVCQRINAQLIDKLLNQSGEQVADDAVEKYIKEMENQFRKDKLVREYVDHLEGTAEYGFENVINYRLTQTVFAGGAHPSTTTTILRFNAMTGDFISLDNVFPSANHDALIDLLTAKLMKDNGVDSMEGLHEIGYLEFMDMFVTPNFALRKDSIEFYYNEYDIAPYAYGPSTICLDYATVEPLMNTLSEDSE
ncbi:MAG: DUF3298 domain-containing protein [Prevotellaceae bacterium]|nr:DUF3298 domain-containing protein [Prevotellaceae bacterium]